MAGRMELCGCSSCVWSLRSFLNIEGILIFPMFLLSDGSLIWMWSASFVWWCRVLLSLSIIEKFFSSAFGWFVEMPYKRGAPSSLGHRSPMKPQCDPILSTQWGLHHCSGTGIWEADPGEVDDFRAKVRSILRRSIPPQPNISRVERIAIKELKQDQSRIILTADKEVALVVLDKRRLHQEAWRAAVRIEHLEKLPNSPHH